VVVVRVNPTKRKASLIYREWIRFIERRINRTRL
jgi:hypothetical protein